MGFMSILFKIMWKPNGLSQSFEILHEQMVGYTTRLKKKAAPYFELMYKKEIIWKFFCQSHLKDFQIFFHSNSSDRKFDTKLRILTLGVLISMACPCSCLRTSEDDSTSPDTTQNKTVTRYIIAADEDETLGEKIQEII